MPSAAARVPAAAADDTTTATRRLQSQGLRVVWNLQEPRQPLEIAMTALAHPLLSLLQRLLRLLGRRHSPA